MDGVPRRSVDVFIRYSSPAFAFNSRPNLQKHFQTPTLQIKMSTPSLTELASKISAAAATIDTYLKDHNVPATSFETSSPPGLPHVPEVVMAKMQLLEALSDIAILTQGPAEAMTISCMLVRSGDAGL
jgi:hypothetical protein